MGWLVGLERIADGRGTVSRVRRAIGTARRRAPVRLLLSTSANSSVLNGRTLGGIFHAEMSLDV